VTIVIHSNQNFVIISEQHTLVSRSWHTNPESEAEADKNGPHSLGANPKGAALPGTGAQGAMPPLHRIISILTIWLDKIYLAARIASELLPSWNPYR
jgi:hypothetical protein